MIPTNELKVNMFRLLDVDTQLSAICFVLLSVVGADVSNAYATIGPLMFTPSNHRPDKTDIDIGNQTNDSGIHGGTGEHLAENETDTTTSVTTIEATHDTNGEHVNDTNGEHVKRNVEETGHKKGIKNSRVTNTTLDKSTNTNAADNFSAPVTIETIMGIADLLNRTNQENCLHEIANKTAEAYCACMDKFSNQSQTPHFNQCCVSMEPVTMWCANSTYTNINSTSCQFVNDKLMNCSQYGQHVLSHADMDYIHSISYTITNLSSVVLITMMLLTKFIL